MKEIPNMDELLNSFIDGELPARKQTEIQRLIAHDEKVAQRLEQLKRCKMLLNSLPVAETPPQVLENIKASLARRTLLDEESLVVSEATGARHLLGRRLLAAAAMIGLLGILAVVVYTILAPQTGIDMPVATDEPVEELPKVELRESLPAAMVVAPFVGKLELRTSYQPAVVAFINRAIEENIPSNEWISSGRSDVKEPHVLVCSGESFNLLLANMGNIWDKLDSASLFVGTDVFSEEVVIESVTAEQIADIVNQSDSARRVEVAKDFAMLNSVADNLPGREILPAIDDIKRGLITPPKPIMTGNRNTIQETTTRIDINRNVRLTITVTSSK